MPLIHVDDLECWYEDDYFGEPWLSGRDVVLMQTGYAANSSHFQTWVPGLADQYRVIRRDSIGHGGSSAGRTDHDLSLEGLSQDIVHFLDALDIDSVHYVGERTGAMTGVVLAALQPQRVKSLVLIGCPIRCGEPLDRALRAMLPVEKQEIYPGWDDAIKGMGGAFAWHKEVKWLEFSNEPEKSKWQQEQLHRCNEEVLERYARATSNYDIEDYLPRVKVPTLVLAPTGSYRSSLEDQVSMWRALQSGRIEVMSGSTGRPDDGSAARGTTRIREFLASGLEI